MNNFYLKKKRKKQREKQSFFALFAFKDLKQVKK